MSKDSNLANGISFQAIFSKASTLVDGSWRLSFDVNANQVSELIRISQLQGVVLQVAVIPIGGKRG